MNPETDDVNHPSHYDFGPLQAREIIEHAVDGFRDPSTIYHVASALKYLLRASRKGGTEDIAKAGKHIGWALDAARAYDVRKERADDAFTTACREIGARMLDPGIRDAGEFTQPPNCVHESTKSTNAGHMEIVDSKHPMHAVALEMADAAAQKRRGESDWAVTWPGEIGN